MLENLSALLAILIALSVASERLVEIVKNLVPYLHTTQAESNAEARRKALLQLLAVGAGVLTAFLAKDVLPIDATDKDFWHLLALGLLASGGSGLWTSLLGYVTSVKDVGKVKYAQRNLVLAVHNARVARGSAPAPARLGLLAGQLRAEAADPGPEATLPPQQAAVIKTADENLRRAIELASTV